MRGGAPTRTAFVFFERPIRCIRAREYRSSTCENFPSRGRRERSRADVFQAPIQHSRCAPDGEYRMAVDE
jgi:hypothetical protein